MLSLVLAIPGKFCPMIVYTLPVHLVSASQLHLCSSLLVSRPRIEKIEASLTAKGQGRLHLY